jgi:hypothetical protein
MAEQMQQMELALEPVHADHKGDTDAGTDLTRRTQFGRSRVTYTPARSILTACSGFIGAYDYTLNPYSGCTFGCSYCYAAFFVRDQADQDTWGQWVRVKENALELLQRKRRKPLIDKTILYEQRDRPVPADRARAAPHARPLGGTRELPPRAVGRADAQPAGHA